MLVESFLWWDELIQSAKEVGPREASILFPKLVIAPGTTKPPSVILLDDVASSGGHLQACEARLRLHGTRVDYALCAGRTVYAEEPAPFSMNTRDLEQYDP